MGLQIIFAAAVLFFGSVMTAAQACENPWGSVSEDKMRAGLPKVQEVRFCLPAGFVEEVREDGVSFRDPNDAAGSRGRLGAAISPGSNYQYSDNEKDYQRLQGWLCQLANISAGTRCAITRLKGNLFVLLKGLGIGVYSEIYIHTGDGYMVALTAEAPSESVLSSLRAVIQDANLP
ncbi:MAG: hypothetical protein Q8K68_00215 [Nitrospirota bacterium]|nr:hypothetical protein [Nitrospirota bacterium]